MLGYRFVRVFVRIFLSSVRPVIGTSDCGLNHHFRSVSHVQLPFHCITPGGKRCGPSGTSSNPHHSNVHFGNHKALALDF